MFIIFIGSVQARANEWKFNSFIETEQQSGIAAKDSVNDEKTYSVVDNMPAFPGGDKALLNYIYSKINYPEDAQVSKKEGKVFVQFTVTKTGKIENARVIRGVSASLDKEAIRVVNTFPDWIPGEQNRKKVNVLYTLPINFRLNPINSAMQKATVIVNGHLMPTGFDMASINPKNIKSVNVIKPDSINKNSVLLNKYREFATTGVIIIKTSETSMTDSLNLKENKENFVYSVIEQMAQFPGGEKELVNFISMNLKYPAESLKNKEQGRVVLRFIVNKTGKIEKAEVIRSVSFLLDKEALRVVNMIPDFIPGKQNGKNVSVYYTMPISFNLGTDTSEPKYLINENKNSRSKSNYHTGF